MWGVSILRENMESTNNKDQLYMNLLLRGCTEVLFWTFFRNFFPKNPSTPLRGHPRKMQWTPSVRLLLQPKAHQSHSVYM